MLKSAAWPNVSHTSAEEVHQKRFRTTCGSQDTWI